MSTEDPYYLWSPEYYDAQARIQEAGMTDHIEKSFQTIRQVEQLQKAYKENAELKHTINRLKSDPEWHGNKVRELQEEREKFASREDYDIALDYVKRLSDENRQLRADNRELERIVLEAIKILGDPQ